MKGSTLLEEIPYNMLRRYKVSQLNKLINDYAVKLVEFSREGRRDELKRLDKEQDLIIAVVELKLCQKHLKKALKETK